MAKKKDDIVNIDELADMFDLPDWETIQEMNWEYVADAGQYAFDEALDESDAEDNETLEEEAETAREKAETEAQDEIYSQWYDGVHTAAERLFEEHHLRLDPIPVEGRTKFAWEFKVVPATKGQKGWRKSAEEMLETINGVGHFYFSDLDDFLDSGPYTAREAVLEHLAYISYWPEVYGSHSARTIYDWSWR